MTESFRSSISAADSAENDVAVIAIPLFENDDIFKKIPEDEKIMEARSEHRKPSSSTEKTETSTSFFFLPTLSTNRRDQHKVGEIVMEDAVSSLNIRYSTIQRGPQQDYSKTSSQNTSAATTATATTTTTTTITTATTSTTKTITTTATPGNVSDTISEESFMDVSKILVSTTTESQNVDVVEEKEVIILTTTGEDDITNTEGILTSSPASTKDEVPEVTTKAIKEAIEDTTDKKERDEESESDVNSKTDLNEVLTDQLRDAVKRGLTKEVDIYSCCYTH